MIALLLAVVLQVDAGVEPQIVSVHHGDVYLDLPDGGYSDAPLKLGSSVCMDEPTAIALGKSKAQARGEHSVGPEVDTSTVLKVGLVMFVVGALAGGAVVAVLK